MAITDETMRISADTRAALGGMIDAQGLALVQTWVTAWDDLVPEFETAIDLLLAAAKDGSVSRAAAMHSQYLAAALDHARMRLEELANTAGATIIQDLPDVTEQGYVAQSQMIGTQLPAGKGGLVAPLDRGAIALDAIVARTTERVHSLIRPLSADAVAVMNRELVRSVAVGDNPRAVARRMIRSAESGFNGGLTRALTISRTEILDAHRGATQAADEANEDLMAGWIWGATLSARTCPSCLAQHGKLHPIEEPGPLDHPNGRCDRIPKTKSWAELGFDGVDEPEDLVPDAEEWFNNLTPETQRTIMGPERLQLLQSGKVSWSALSQRTKNDGWRDSFSMTPVKTLKGKAAA